jgi:hypothetical protein
MTCPIILFFFAYQNERVAAVDQRGKKPHCGDASRRYRDGDVAGTSGRRGAAAVSAPGSPPTTVAAGSDVRVQPAANAGMNASTMSSRFSMRGTILDSRTLDNRDRRRSALRGSRRAMMVRFGKS